jgi:hypothetical protein
LVFFFDEAHLLFDQAPKTLLDKIEQVVRLIRSKGVGVFFISQSPLDIPDDVMGQLGLKILHALRAFTPKDRKTIKAASESFPSNPEVDIEKAITEMAVGEALVSALDKEGRPSPVSRIYIKPPESKMGPVTDQERMERISRSPLKGKYDNPIDRESACEVLNKRAQAAHTAEESTPTWKDTPQRGEKPAYIPREAPAPRAPGRTRETAGEAFMKSAARSIASQLGRNLANQVLGKGVARGVLGSILGGLGR